MTSQQLRLALSNLSKLALDGFGNPGMKRKSRLKQPALLERLVTEQHTRLRYFCSPQHTDSALYPIIGQMERAARLTHNEQRK